MRFVCVRCTYRMWTATESFLVCRFIACYCKIHFNLISFSFGFDFSFCCGCGFSLAWISAIHVKAKRLIDTPSITSDHIGCHSKRTGYGLLQWNTQPIRVFCLYNTIYLYTLGVLCVFGVWFFFFFAINVALLFLCLFFLVYLHLCIPHISWFKL